MDITVVGTGYVGLVAGTCFADMGNRVFCVDIDSKKIGMLNDGKCPIYEPGLEPLIEKNVKAKRLFFTTDIKKAINETEIIFIAVGTPPKPNGDADLSFVENVAKTIAETATEPKIVVEKSTVPVETGERIAAVLKLYNPHNVVFEVVSNPEFLREGSAVKDFLVPDRIVIGASSEHARKKLGELYSPLKAKILFTDVKSAEIIKHASNSFLATKISFINAIADICDNTGADVKLVAEGMGLDARIGKSFLNPGIGYGGFCFPKDVEAFIRIAEKKGYDFRLLKEVQEINHAQRKIFVKKIEQQLWNLNNKKICVLGLAFKPNTDDMRFAPSIDIIKMLQDEGAKIFAYDPVAMERAKSEIRGIEFCSNAYAAAKDAEALLVLTEWQEFLELDFKKIRASMKTHFLFDGRNCLDSKKMISLGFKYFGMGSQGNNCL
ncbi:MAG: UDP-glucose/GDP-mannose dehydrogenase family protein [Candidatus ainarchaeum sp.]|nr:UDP-glucose/GDP-mannose dehydrogenase family protein [Candidatus ainarchaeum sp.]